MRKLGSFLSYIYTAWWVHYSPNREPFSLEELQGAVLRSLDGSGREVRAGDLWRERGAVIVVVRRPG